MTYLPLDYARCNGLGCIVKNTCSRFLGRNDGEILYWIMPRPDKYGCEHYIKHKGEFYGKNENISKR